MKIKPIALLLAAGIAALGSVRAADIIIDNFQFDSIVLSLDHTDIVGGSNVAVSGVIGGHRFATLSQTSGGDATHLSNLDINNGGSGFASYSSADGVSGSWSLQYGSTDDLNVNLTADGNWRFALEFLGADLAGTVTITVITTGVGVSSYTLPVSPTFGTTLYADFSSFTGSANFSNVDTIIYEFNTPTAADWRVEILSVVPEPTTSALFAVAGMAVLFFRPRGRK
jgi:hypothetical protein